MSEYLIYALVAIVIAGIVYLLMGKSGPNSESYDADMNEVLDLSRACLTEAKETNRLLKEMIVLLEKK